jgi:hypothetical protein
MESWRILLFGREGSELLLFRGVSGLRLPELHVPRRQRPAALLNAEAQRLWGVKAVCVSPLGISGPARRDSEKYYVMELLHSNELARIAPHFVELSAVKEDSFARAADYAAIRQIMEQERNSTSNGSGTPFADLGSFRRISSWVEQQLNPLSLHWDGSFRQFHADASFALIRFSTSQKAYWFKAVGEPNLRELPVTLVLAARFPRHVPQPLAVHAEWNAWLTPEADGQELSSSTTPAEWHQAAESLAELQVASIQHAPDILAAGARDVRSQHLVDLAASFFCAMEQTMEAQTKTGPQKLTRHEIAKVCNQVKDVLRQLDDAGIPDTLNHLDLNPDNVFTAASRSTFLDWAEAAVGNPFLSFEYLRQHFLRRFPCARGIDGQLRDSYRKPWTQFLPDVALEKALLLIPLAAAFAYASALPWNDASLNRRLRLAGHLRSMVRRMHHEVQQLKSRAA